MNEHETGTAEVETTALSRVEMGVLRASSPKDLVTNAAEVATVLAGVIKSQSLSVDIQGHEYVKAEGWATLAAMLGVTPHEESSVRLEDGGYEATVKLVRINDGAVIGRASAICGMDEDKWAKGPEYARKSMAATRATGKACRLAFSWIMQLAGFQPTPAEEMPGYRWQYQKADDESTGSNPSDNGGRNDGEKRRGGSSRPATEKQLNMIYAKSKAASMTKSELRELSEKKTGKASDKDYTMDDIQTMVAAIDEWNPLA